MSVSELARRRRELKITQGRLASLIHVHPGSISNWERGLYKSLKLRLLVSYVLDAVACGRRIEDEEIRNLALKEENDVA